MSRLVKMAFVKYYYPTVDVPDNYPDNIDDWDDEQVWEMQNKGREWMQERVGNGFEVDDSFEMELTRID